MQYISSHYRNLEVQVAIMTAFTLKFLSRKPCQAYTFHETYFSTYIFVDAHIFISCFMISVCEEEYKMYESYCQHGCFNAMFQCLM